MGLKPRACLLGVALWASAGLAHAQAEAPRMRPEVAPSRFSRLRLGLGPSLIVPLSSASQLDTVVGERVRLSYDSPATRISQFSGVVELERFSMQGGNLVELPAPAWVSMLGFCMSASFGRKEAWSLLFGTHLGVLWLDSKRVTSGRSFTLGGAYRFTDRLGVSLHGEFQDWEISVIDAHHKAQNEFSFAVISAFLEVSLGK